MTNTIISDYEVTTAYIKQNIDDITEFARSFISNEPSEDEDIFHAFNDRVDLNFVLDEDTQNWNCYAYPVVNGTPSYDQEYEVHIPVDVDTYKVVRNYHPNTGRSSKVVLVGLTLQEAKAHCRREDTRKEGEWFDGYEKETK